MNKNTLTFERKLYVAPACKTHVLQVEENIMSGDGTWDNSIQGGSTWANEPEEGYGMD